MCPLHAQINAQGLLDDVFISLDISDISYCDQLDKGVTSKQGVDRSSFTVEVYAPNFSRKNLTLEKVEIIFDFHVGLLRLLTVPTSAIVSASNRSNIFGKIHINGRKLTLSEPFEDRTNLEYYDYVTCIRFDPLQSLSDIPFYIRIEEAVFHTKGGQVDTVRAGDVLTFNGADPPPGPFARWITPAQMDSLMRVACDSLMVLVRDKLRIVRDSLQLAKKGDINCDGVVNVEDFLILSNHFGLIVIE